MLQSELSPRVSVYDIDSAFFDHQIVFNTDCAIDWSHWTMRRLLSGCTMSMGNGLLTHQRQPLLSQAQSHSRE
ncbi:hypothetical protein BDW02DRAFT_569785 [Decorospora gaudefroyi]|uniref:Uncharacterized protein n=1 Tax=Decorospora gaudefroyi TaxID=184978 RepID=A0A6A5KGU3_9PLEO|nr:hypothetical protein BDW02DRAFT_569785 [Decorospora gaudefroyi]